MFGVIIIKIMMSGGKTAGHIMPAIQIMKNFKEAEFYYAGSKEELEKNLTKGYIKEYLEYDLCGINRKKPFTIFKTIYFFNKAYHKAKNDLKKIKPDIVMGMGGNISAPLILAAKKLKIKTVIHEQNVVYGLTNKYLKNKVDLVLLSFDSLSDGLVVGNPTQERVNNYQKTEIVYPKDYHKVLFIGGSLGARLINELAVKIIEETRDLNIYYVLIVGNNYEVKKQYKNATILKYTNDLNNIMQEVDLIISRAGASTIAEVINIPKPLILIPSPNVTNNHQEKNASYLENRGLAKMIKESEAEEKLKKEMLDILLSKTQIQNDGKGDAVWRIIEELKKMNYTDTF